jgi:phosphatidylglycerophosphatase A
VRRFLLSGFGIGFLPLVPGTWASAATAAAVLLVERQAATTLVPPLAALALGTLVTLSLAKPSAGEACGDPPWVVSDEVAGQGAALALAEISSRGRLAPAVAAFVLFRVFDVWKPGPIGRAERLPGALGVLADDLAAGVASGALVAGACAVGAFG